SGPRVELERGADDVVAVTPVGLLPATPSGPNKVCTVRRSTYSVSFRSAVCNPQDHSAGAQTGRRDDDRPIVPGKTGSPDGWYFVNVQRGGRGSYFFDRTASFDGNSISQRRIDFSTPADATRRPSGLIAMAYSVSAWPLSAMSSFPV